MNQTQLLQDFESLPQNAQQETLDFIAFMKLRYGQCSNKTTTNFSLLLTELAEFRHQQVISHQSSLQDVQAIRQEARY